METTQYYKLLRMMEKNNKMIDKIPDDVRIRLNRIHETICGTMTLSIILNCIGSEGQSDHTIAKLIVDHEMELRSLIKFAVSAITDEINKTLSAEPPFETDVSVGE